MTARLRALAPALTFAGLLAYALAWSGLMTPAFTDYEVEAEPSVDALRAGHLHQFLLHAPAYGGSLILRAPFALLPNLWNGGGLAAYRSLAAPALIATVALGVWLWQWTLASGMRHRTAWLSLALAAGSPITLTALDLGHPEEVLGAVLVAASAIAAVRGRAGWAGLLLGLALVNKPWAVLAIAPILLTLQAGRVRAAGVALVTAGVGLAPIVLSSSAAVDGATATAHTSGGIFQPWQLWWFSGGHDGVVRGLNGTIKPGYRTPPEWVAAHAHLVVVIVPILLAALLVGVRRRQGSPVTSRDGLSLLAATLMLRCLLDPWNISYYSAPFLMALLVWELHTRRALPLVTLFASAAAYGTLDQLGARVSADGQAAAYLAWAVPLGGYLIATTLAPAATARVSGRVTAWLATQLPSLARAAQA